MRTAVVGAVLLVLGAIAVAVGILPLPEVAVLWDRVWPILLFVIAVTVVTELAAEAGLFTWVAQRAARWGRGRAWVLWLLVVLVAALCTIFLSLDTTAVLLTPVVIVLARHAGLNPLPFALTTVWMANAGSLLLPVSNLTNLLAQHAMGDPSPAAFAALMWAPALVAMVVPMMAVFVIARRSLVVRYEPGEEESVGDRVLFATSAIVVVALVPLLVSGLPVWLPASAAAIVLGAVFVVRRRSVLRFGLVPWQLVVLASGLFLFIEALHAVGLGALLAAVSGTGESPLALLRLSLTGMVGANAIDNLPAYLALEPVAGSPVRLAALLIGVNAGPLVTPWASLATLLWHQRLTSFDVELRWKRYVLLGAIVAPVTVVLATLALAVTG
ncbi:SLC13 family permease [Leifsonia naganoensis]|uniref:Na+/H+ antiporter NhaD/arsenite permease-like protein n=1 Tax=Leifsonia naganoensis TaxID=150025 RepID=A0A853DGB9_9MICO|nr:SLC13 family permease [Leifsonia naganoensis]NYK08122.1 Na+/H+ antiporter NhaD/arsenite permease-like protein [Leifsonia naganoensis]